MFQEEVDCEAIYQELVARYDNIQNQNLDIELDIRYPRTGRLEQLFLPVGGKTRADFLEGVILVLISTYDHSEA